MRTALFILADLTDTDLLLLAGAGTLRHVSAGEPIITAGEAVDSLFLITAGRFEVVTRQDRRIAELPEGEIVGEMSFVEKRLPDATVRALEESRVFALPRAATEAFFETDPATGMRFYRALAMFLSDRLRSLSGGGEGELDEMVLDTLQQAGERFVRLVGMLEGRV